MRVLAGLSLSRHGPTMTVTYTTTSNMLQLARKVGAIYVRVLTANANMAFAQMPVTASQALTTAPSIDSVGGDQQKKSVLAHDPWADSLEQVVKRLRSTSVIINIGLILILTKQCTQTRI